MLSVSSKSTTYVNKLNDEVSSGSWRENEWKFGCVLTRDYYYIFFRIKFWIFKKVKKKKINFFFLFFKFPHYRGFQIPYQSLIPHAFAYSNISLTSYKYPLRGSCSFNLKQTQKNKNKFQIPKLLIYIFSFPLISFLTFKENGWIRLEIKDRLTQHA